MNRFLLIFILFISHSSQSQQLNFFTPDKLKSIPSSETYNILQDSKGYLWFSTEAGLCKYNGSDIQVFDEKNGLNEKSCYSVKADSYGNLLIITSANRILTYRNGELKETFYSKQYSEHFSKDLEQTYFCNIKNDSIFYLATQHYTYELNCKTGLNKVVLIPNGNSVDYLFKKIGNSYIPVKVGKLNDSIALEEFRNNKLKIAIANEVKTLNLNFLNTSNNPSTSRVLIAKNNLSQYFFGFGNSLLVLNSDMTYSLRELPSTILEIYCDKNDGLWVGMHKGGVCYFPNTHLMDYKITSLSEYSVTGICEDNEKGVWCSTLEKGIFYCRNKNVVNYNNISGLNKRSEMLKSIDNRIYVSSENNSIIEINNNIIQNHILDFNKNNIISDLIWNKDNLLVAGKEYIVSTTELFNNRNHVGLVNKTFNTGANQLIKTRSNKIFGVKFGDIIEVKQNEVSPVISPLPSPGRCIFFSDEYGLLVGCKDGLYKVDTLQKVLKKESKVLGSVTKIIETAQHQLWVTTKDNGVFIINGTHVSNLKDIVGVPTNRFFDILEDRYGNLWIGSNKGLVKLTLKNGIPKFTLLNTLNGILSNEVYKLALDSNFVYLSTNEGICRFPITISLKNTRPPLILLNSIKINDNYQSERGRTMIFPHNMNSLNLKFDVLTYKEEASTLAYLIKGEGGTIHYINGRELQLNNLPPAKYELTIYGVNGDHLFSLFPVKVNFEIQQPYWRTAYFILFSILFIALFFYLVILNIISRIRKKEGEKTRINKLIAEYQLSALKAQMNPHFIFNCINSIQRYILTNNSEVAYDYLSKFSKLIRHVLNYSDTNMITLAQEIEIVELYIDLEQMRFDNKFSYSIVGLDKIDKDDLVVPAMILQPYIENAIWHGIMNLSAEQAGLNKQTKGCIEIKLTYVNDLLKIIIEDNGVGREQAALLSKKNHQSKSSEINQKRADILNTIGNKRNQASVVIEDILFPATGTRVIINIPQNTNDNN